MPVVGLETLPGTALSEGSFVITHAEDLRVREVVGGEPASDGLAHPLWAYIAPQRGIGTSVAELCALAAFDVNDGPMLGSSELEYHGPIRIGVRYRVTGRVIDITRKHGSTGTFDVMEFREDMHDEAGELVATSISTYILPRRD
jgi:acyl dehydratase